MNAIKQFVDFKYKTPEQYKAWQQSSEDRFRDFPIDIALEDEVVTAYIQDVLSEDLGTMHKTSVIMLDENWRGFEAVTTCISPCSELNWDKVVCAFKIYKN